MRGQEVELQEPILLEEQEEVSSKKDGKRVRGVLKEGATLAAIALAFFLFFRVIAGTAVVSGASMEPTLHTGDRLFYARVLGESRGDIVVFHLPSGEELIKRVIAVPGDRVQIMKGSDGRPELFVGENGGPLQKMQESYVASWVGNGPVGCCNVIGQGNGVSAVATVPPGEIFVMGDNRDVSLDSRVFGFIPDNTVDGKIFV